MEIKIHHVLLAVVLTALLVAFITWKVNDNATKKKLADPANTVDEGGNIIPISGNGAGAPATAA